MFGRSKNTSSRSRTPRQASEKSQIFSYYSNRPPERAAATRSAIKATASTGFRWQFVPGMIALLAIVVSFAYVLTLDTNPRLSQKAFEEPSLLQDASVYQQATQRILKQSIFNRSKALIDTKAIENQLMEQFPELAEVSITIPLTGRRPIVALRPVVPRLILRTDTGAYVLDTAGKAVLKVSSDDKAAQLNLPIVQDETGLEVTLNKSALGSNDASFITEVVHQLQAAQLEVDQLTLPAIPHELHIRVKDQPYYVKFNLQGDPAQQAGAFLAVKEQVEADRAVPAEYIDVRVDERAYLR